jgi:hypothetical protein
VWADGKIYVSEVDSKFHILKPSRSGCESLHRYQFRSIRKGGIPAPVELHGSPAIVNGRVYFTTTEQLYCIGKKDKAVAADKIPESIKEPAEVGAAAFLQVFPADVAIKPGENVELTAIAYDANGRRIGPVKVNWEKGAMLPLVYPIGITPPRAVGKPAPPPVIAGDLSANAGVNTIFTAAKAPNGQFGRVVARFNGLTGHGRIRVVPTLPYHMDFKNVPDGRTPAAWVNTMGKFAVVTLPDGTKALRKRNDNSNPIVNRANAYIGDPDMQDYTIEADLRSSKVRDQYMGDMGVGACRYSLLLIGNDQEVRLVTWDAQKRTEKKMSFEYKPGVWYRMRLMATVQGGKGIVKGKVWPRNEKEPDGWMLEIVDPIPNEQGAPLIYGSANGTIDEKNPGPEILFANIKITPNKK